MSTTTVVAFERTLVYNAKGQLTTDTSITLRTNTYYRSITTNDYGAGASYALGAVVSSTTTNAERTSVTNPWTTKPTSRITNSYLGRDGALIQTVTNDTDTGSSSNPLWTTNYSYDRRNDLLLADVNDGRPRDVAYITDLGGQIIQRKETFNATPTGPTPFERHTRFGGKELEAC